MRGFASVERRQFIHIIHPLRGPPKTKPAIAPTFSQADVYGYAMRGV
jgi:hypothetical protein